MRRIFRAPRGEIPWADVTLNSRTKRCCGTGDFRARSCHSAWGCLAVLVKLLHDRVDQGRDRDAEFSCDLLQTSLHRPVTTKCDGFLSHGFWIHPPIVDLRVPMMSAPRRVNVYLARLPFKLLAPSWLTSQDEQNQGGRPRIVPQACRPPELPCRRHHGHHPSQLDAIGRARGPRFTRIYPAPDRPLAHRACRRRRRFHHRGCRKNAPSSGHNQEA